MKTCIRLFSYSFLALILLSSCRSRENNHGTSLVFRYNESNGISGLDPAFARTQSLIWPVYQIFNGLVEMNDELEIVPSLARTWEISEDGRRYVFHLRTDVKFHDHPAFPGQEGRKMVAGDFVYSFNRIRDPDLLSPGRWVFSYVEKEDGFIALDDSTFQVRLIEAFTPFLGILSMPYCYVVPKEAIEFDSIRFSRYPSGTGPFKFKFWREEEKLVLVKNPIYFEKDSTGNNLPYLDAVSISFIKDKQSEFMEFLLGNLDYLSGMHPTYKDELITRSGNINPAYSNRFRIITRNYLNTEYLAFLADDSIEQARQSPLGDINLRKAINYGFDRVKMMKYLRNNIGTPALGGFVPQGIADYRPSRINGYTYDPDTAAYFLNQAGYPGGEGLQEIVLTTTSDYLDICEFIQFELRKLGIKLRIEVSTGAAFRNMVLNSNLDFFRASWIADYPDPESYLSLFYSGNFSPAGPNYTHYSDPVYDSLYRLSNKIRNRNERLEVMYIMDQMIINASVIVPLFYDQVLRIVPLNISGFESNAMNLPKLKYVRKVN